MSIATNIHNSIDIKYLRSLHQKILLNIMTRNESKALELINLLRTNNLESAFGEEENKNVELWPCTLLETAESMKMTRIINLLKSMD